MAGLDSIKGYAEGEEVVAEPTTTVGGGLELKANSKGVPQPVGKMNLDQKSSEELMRNMEAMLAERKSPWRTFNRGLERMSAWAVPSLEGGKAQALTSVNRQQDAEDLQTSTMQQQLAAYKAAQASQANDATRLSGIMSGGAGGAGGAGAGPGVGSAGGTPPIPADVQARMTAARTPGDALAIHDEWLKGRVTESTKKEFSPAMATIVDVFNPDTKKIEQMTQAQAEKILSVNPSLYRGTSQVPAAGGVNASNIRQVESGGNPNAVSPKGAVGVMQTMPNTLKDPGFGVPPAKDNSPAELQRVGEDYYKAMQNRYGHDTLAAVAYNMGPGATDAWIQKGGKFEQLPAETRDYIGKVNLANAMQARQQPAAAAAPGAGVGPAPKEVVAPTTPAPTTKAEYLEQEAARKLKTEEGIKTEAKGLSAELEAKGKDISARNSATVKAYDNADTNLSNVKYVSNLVNTNPKAFGVLQHPTVAAAIGTILEGGATMPGGMTKVSNIDDAVRKAMKGSSEADIIAAQKAANKFSELQLNAAQVVLKGQGAVSDNERALVANMTGSTKNSPQAIRDFMAWTEMRSNFDKKVGNALEDWEKANPSKSYREFELSPQYKILKTDYAKQIDSFAEKAGNYRASTAPVAKPSGYDEWIASRKKN